MVEGFTVDKDSPKPDCIVCTEAKQHVEPFPQSSIRKTEASESTHIDLWEKYSIRLINGHQYYLLLVDDAKRFATIECVKQKSDAAQAIINYLAHLKTQGRNPNRIQIDCGKEFVNSALRSRSFEPGKDRGLNRTMNQSYGTVGPGSTRLSTGPVLGSHSCQHLLELSRTGLDQFSTELTSP